MVSALDMALIAVTFGSAGLFAYHHIGHPIVQRIICAMLKAPPQPDFGEIEKGGQNEALPHISLMMPAYNEADHILPKLENLMVLIYPADKLDITIVCDGCQDDTAKIVRAFLDRAGPAFPFTLNLIDHQDNVGKLRRLNETIPTLTGDIVALTDVSAILSVDCLLRLAKWFEMPSVGGLVGQYRLLQAGGAGQGVYWDYQVRIKQQEDRMGSVLGAHGAFYAFRKSAFQALEPDTINDDFVLPMRMIAQGLAVRYDSGILALEKEIMDETEEGSRRLRIAQGNIQQAIRLRGLLNPRFGWVAYNFAAGKVLRALCPLLLVVCFAGSAYLLSNHRLFLLLTCAQLAIYLAVFCDMIIIRLMNGKKNYLLGAVTYMFVGHWYGLRAIIWQVLWRNRQLNWR